MRFVSITPLTASDEPPWNEAAMASASLVRVAVMVAPSVADTARLPPVTDTRPPTMSAVAPPRTSSSATRPETAVVRGCWLRLTLKSWTVRVMVDVTCSVSEAVTDTPPAPALTSEVPVGV